MMRDVLCLRNLIHSCVINGTICVIVFFFRVYILLQVAVSSNYDVSSKKILTLCMRLDFIMATSDFHGCLYFYATYRHHLNKHG